MIIHQGTLTVTAPIGNTVAVFDPPTRIPCTVLEHDERDRNQRLSELPHMIEPVARVPCTIPEHDDVSNENSESGVQGEGLVEEADSNGADATKTGNEDAEIEAQTLEKTRQLNFFRSALGFIRVVEGAEPRIRQLLMSTNKSDVLEVMKLLVKAKQFGLPCATDMLNKSWSLIWSNDQGHVISCLSIDHDYE